MSWIHPSGDAEDSVGSLMERTGLMWKNCRLITQHPTLLFCWTLLHQLDKQHCVSFSLLHIGMIMWQGSSQCDMSLSLLRHHQGSFFLIQILSSLYLILFEYGYNGWSFSSHIAAIDKRQEDHEDFSCNVLNNWNMPTKCYLQTLLNKNKLCSFQLLFFLLALGKFISNRHVVKKIDNHQHMDDNWSQRAQHRSEEPHPLKSG